VLDVGDAGHAVGEGGIGARPPAGFRDRRGGGLFGEGDEVDGLLAFAEGDHLGEDAACCVEEEIYGLRFSDGA